ncbi:LytR family transcriptional regulator [Corynebacterium sp. 320]|uniref:LCP family protein n=1 Tax=Corynebacterium TaxID=1716 RepID=UPI00125CBCB7|nr:MULTISPECIES: LCP family protein [Corynebacterium]KAB1504182.1 LytR family transcriptional regulator [Corynebacterium sp. 320]KAB1552718.1 LytR family transcriptional regulator [Corynebacterium sp. 321]KAB1554064.1 LytR family transcriptional regulator [Corynebacterium sp. 319]KAB3528318.1 LytR family transcriptional regulator [Corynebacterium sp. 250]KAB3540193.1 LytR family transcriptional regulator [Corynebacterium sp. 366]
MSEDNISRHSRRINPAVTAGARQIGSKPAKAILAGLSAVLLGVTGAGYSVLGGLDNKLASAGGLDLGGQTDGAMDILLTGVDSRTDAQGNPLSQEEIDMLRAGEEEVTNTDTMVLIRIPNDGSGATAVSLPRDTYVKTDNFGNTKLNGVYGIAKQDHADKMVQAGVTDEKTIQQESSEAGRKELINSIADLTGIKVDHYAEVGLLGFVLLTNAVGGVDVCLNNDVSEPLSGANFKKGTQTLDGADALSFVRQRHDLPRGDLDRITRQQVYMASLVSKILSTGTLTNPSKLNELSGAVQRSVVLDSGWDVMGLATQMQNLSGGNVSFQTIPVTSIDGTGDYGESIVTVDKKQVHAFFKDLLGEEDGGEKADAPNYPAREYTVAIKNGSDTQGLASRVSEITASFGFTPGEVGNAEESGDFESFVSAHNAEDPAAIDLAKKLGGLKIVEDPGLGDKELSVSLSSTYNGPGLTDEEAPEDQPEENSDVVGEEGSIDDTGGPDGPIHAGGDTPMCVN